ncbi:unnamed protein product [Hymenolepis diminuta]|uniref:Uncharacterized protein n=1 Tax=Hymenolepis diminuta TaxID=6216 RepID=A0A564YLI4_HYMDI|nr:unnamed protein product [Hymenolepis diminuta]
MSSGGGKVQQRFYVPLGGTFDLSSDHAGSETGRDGTTSGMEDSIECVKLVAFMLALIDGCSFMLSLEPGLELQQEAPYERWVRPGNE